MTRTEMHQAEAGLLNEIRLLADRMDKALGDAMEALRTRDLTLARAVVDGDAAINAERYRIEDQVVAMLARHAPVASDLREILAALFIATDLERMADHAEGIARIVLFLKDNPIAAEVPGLWDMADRVQQMLRAAIQSFLERDEALARRTCNLDDAVDTLYDDIHRRLIERLARTPTDAHQFDVITHVLWASHNLERIGDRATNICERAIFLATGELLEINVSSY